MGAMHPKPISSDVQASALPLVVVCTPVYNGARYIAETMEAVQAQTYPNLLHVISENASTDQTGEILARYGSGRVPVLVSRSDETIPQMANWNRAVGLAPPDAKWIRLLCADDLMEPTAIAEMVELGESDPDVVLVGCERFRNGAVDDFFWPRGEAVFEGAEASRRYFEYRGTIMGPHVLVRRDVLQADGAVFDESIVCADNDMCLRVLRHGKFGFVHRPLATTREHMATVTTDKLMGWKVHFLEWLIYLDRYGPAIYGQQAFQALRRSYLNYYRRKMLWWRLLDRRPDVFDMHRQRLVAMGVKTGAAEFGEALVDWAAKKLSLRQGWVGYPF